MQWLQKSCSAGFDDQEAALLSVGLPTGLALATLVQQMVTLLQPGQHFPVQANESGFVGVSDLGLALGYSENAVAYLARLASHQQRPIFEVMEFGPAHWVRLVGGPVLALVRAADLFEDGRWVLEA